MENEFKPGHLPEPAAPSRREQELADAEQLDRGIATIEIPDAARTIAVSAICKLCGGEKLVQYAYGTSEGCDCRPKAAGGLERVTAINLPELLSSARHGSAGK